MSEDSTKRSLDVAMVDLLNEARSAASKEERATLLATAREKLPDYLYDRASDPEANYIAGLVMYYSFCLEEEYGKNAEKYLREAVHFSPQHQFARMYLGHYYFDNADYERALEHFERIDDDYFLSLWQRWRVLKLHELILCCKLSLGSPDLTMNNFEQLVREYKSVDEVQAPVPLELVSTLASARESVVWSRVSRVHVLRLVKEMITQLSFDGLLEDLPSS